MNRLIRETSPYLLQHAHNPVDWFPWGEAALEKARTENKPVLVSIGYAACHWCHVMERESFEDATTAAYMNQHFVNIKIDREERPDLDAIYMEAVQLIAGNGGWPLNVFLTPDARPFYGGTYFPPARAYNRSSWMEVLQAINEAWQQRPQEILSQAENLTHHIGSSRLLDQLQEGETVFSTADLQETVAKLLKQADTRWGGFGSAPKFPQTYAIQFLLRQSYFVHQQPPQPAAVHRQQAEWAEKGLQQALLSLDKMILGGLYDQLGGGFARYATDTRWQVPHFEKMLYDNALLISTLSEAYQLTGKPLYKSVIEQTMQFVQSDWVAAEGGFYASYDADSEGVEGKFYTWSKAAIEKTIGADAEQFCRYYQVSDEGNWEETNILWCLEPLEEFCRAHQLDLAATEARFASARQKLLAVRNQRPRPLLDDKILMNWNALMITACCKAFAATGQDTYREMGKTAAAFIEKYLKDATGYYHNYKGKATIPAFLDDLAFYIQALIHLQEITADQQYLVQARTCLESVLNSFSDEADGFFYYTADTQKDVVVRKKEWYDGATPAGNSVMISNLFYLSVVYQNVHWQSRAEQMLSTLKSAVIKYPTSFGFAALGLQQAVFGMDEVTLNGKESEKMLKTLLLPYWPGKVVQTQNREDGQFPLFVNRWPSGSGTDLFLCRNQSCLPPVQTVAALLLQRDKKKAAED